MVFLLRNKRFKDYNGKKVYTDKMFIFKDVMRFSIIDDYSLLFEQVLQFIDKSSKHEGIKARLERLLTIGANLKYFNVGDFSKYNREDYLKKIEEGIELIYNKPLINNMLEEFDVVEITDIEAEMYEKGYVEPKQISVYNPEEEGEGEGEEEGFKIFFPQEICDNYDRHIVVAVEKITGNFYDDVILNMIGIFNDLGVSTEIKDYGVSYSICRLNCHQEIAFALKRLLGTITYLKNCTSMRSNDWFGFDEMYIHDNTGYVESIISNSVNCLR